MRYLTILALALTAAPVLAGAPDTSLHPIARGEQSSQSVLVKPATPARLRPEMRPLSEQMVSMAARSDFFVFASPNNSLRPWLRPPVIEQQAMAKRRARRKGAICGNQDIQGEKIGHVPGRIKGCGFNKAVSVRSISGVKLSRPATMDCTTCRGPVQMGR